MFIKIVGWIVGTCIFTTNEYKCFFSRGKKTKHPNLEFPKDVLNCSRKIAEQFGRDGIDGDEVNPMEENDSNTQ